MFYKKKTTQLPIFKEKRLKLDCNLGSNINYDEDANNIIEGKPRLNVNFKSENGSLTSSSGLRYLVLPTSQSTSDTCTRSLNYSALGGSAFIKIWRYKYYSTVNSKYMYMLIAYMSDKKLYYCNVFGADTNFHLIGNYTFNTTPTSIMFRVNGQDVIAFCAPNTNMLVWYCDSAPYQVSTAPTFLSICLHEGRLFAIDASKTNLVRYSSNTNPLDWTADDSSVDGAGEIDLGLTKGENKVVFSFLGNVYVFNEYGIFKISSYSNSSKFVVSQVFSTTSRIYTETAVVSGENIFFLSCDGFYKFDGYKVEKIDLKISKLLFSQLQKYINTCAFENKIFIACRLDFGDGNDGSNSRHNNAMIEYNIESKSVVVHRSNDILCMYPLQDLLLSKLVCIAYDFAGTTDKYLFEVCDPSETLFVKKKIWQSGKITLGDKSKLKILKKINLHLNCENMSVVFTSDKGSKTFSLSGINVYKAIDVNLPGHEFEVKFESNEGLVIITSPELIFNVEA